MKQYEKIALDFFLWGYPVGWDFHRIVGSLLEGDTLNGQILIAKHFGRMRSTFIGDQIRELSEQIKKGYEDENKRS